MPGCKSWRQKFEHWILENFHLDRKYALLFIKNEILTGYFFPNGLICVTSVASYLLIFLNASIDLYNIKLIKGSSFCPSITPEFPLLRAYQRTHRCPIGLVYYLSTSQSLIIAWMWNPPWEFNFMSFLGRGPEGADDLCWFCLSLKAGIRAWGLGLGPGGWD